VRSGKFLLAARLRGSHQRACLQREKEAEAPRLGFFFALEHFLFSALALALHAIAPHNVGQTFLSACQMRQTRISSSQAFGNDAGSS
jgi:hypothetical protein